MQGEQQAVEDTVSIHLSSSEFAFTAEELGFVRKYIHSKYPGVMRPLIESARRFMWLLQNESAQERKMSYSCSRTKPEDSLRTQVTEALSYRSKESDLCFIMAVCPIEREDRERFGQGGVEVDGGLRQVLSQLDAFRETYPDVFQYGLTNNGLYAGFVVDELIKFLRHVGEHITVQAFELGKATDGTSMLFIDIGHQKSRSHFIRLRADFS